MLQGEKRQAHTLFIKLSNLTCIFSNPDHKNKTKARAAAASRLLGAEVMSQYSLSKPAP